MDIGRSFSFVFEDEEWIKKVLLAAVASIIPVVGQFMVLGWSLDIARRVINNDPSPLTNPFDDFGGYLMLGLKAMVIGLVYSLPLLIFVLPGSIIGANAESENVALALSVCVGCFSLIYGILLALAMPAAYGILAATDNLGQALNPGKIIEVFRGAPAAYLITILGIIIAGFIAGLGSIACGVGVLATGAYANAMMGHLYGQAYKQATGVI